MSLGLAASDTIMVQYAPPPLQNTAVLISRNRTFGNNEQAPQNKVPAALHTKYGDHSYQEKQKKGQEHIKETEKL
jgi:hypothetical protein